MAVRPVWVVALGLALTLSPARAQEGGWRDLRDSASGGFEVVTDDMLAGLSAGLDSFAAEAEAMVEDFFASGDVVFEGGAQPVPDAVDGGAGRAFLAQTDEAAAPAPLNLQVLVELYTSQGCMSCPPADAMLMDLARRGDILPVALHIDYWDYLGWPDNFARPQFTARQKAYARRDGARSLYTPQFVIGGRSSDAAPRPARLLEAIAGQPAPQISAQSSRAPDGRLVLHLQTPGGLGRGASVGVLTYQPEATVQIRAGENRGRTLRYVNVLRGWTEIAIWDGVQPLRITLDQTAFAGPGEKLALVVQDLAPGPSGAPVPGLVLGAARLPD